MNCANHASCINDANIAIMQMLETRHIHICIMLLRQFAQTVQIAQIRPTTQTKTNKCKDYKISILAMQLETQRNYANYEIDA